MSNLTDALRAAFRVWVIGTFMLFIPGLFGWINEVTQWARAEGTTPFPDARGLGFLFVAAITSAFIAAGAGVLRYVENLSGHTVLPRASGPQPPAPNGERGITTLGLVLIVLLVVVLGLLLGGL
jgi:hypothetical protein